MVRYYDPYNNEYAHQADASLQSLGLTFAAILVILATSAIILKHFEFGKFSASEDQFSVFTSSLLGFVFLAVGIFVIFCMDQIMEGHIHSFYRFAQTATHALIFVCAVYFVLNAAGNARFENVRKKISIVIPVWGVAFLMSSYLNPPDNYGDYNRKLCLVAVSALILFFLYEAEMALKGKASTAYFVFSLFSLVASMVYMIPNFVLMAYWELSTDVNRIFEATLLGTIFYTCACLRNLCLSVKVREKAEKKKKTKKENTAQ